MQDQALPLTRALPVRQNLPSPYPPIFPSPTLADARTCTRTQFENLISRTIDVTKDIPEIISETGKIDMSHKEIMQKIGELFLLRTNINSVGSVLDSPVRTSPFRRPRARRSPRSRASRRPHRRSSGCVRTVRPAASPPR